MIGLAFSAVLIYLLIVVNFQSWLDPFVIITALPAALAGIVWMLFLTNTSLVRPRLDRGDHVHGRGDGQQHPRRQLRTRTARGRQERGRGRARSRRHALQAGLDDRARHDHRHAADGHRARAEFAARARRHRRSHCLRRSRRSCSCRPCSRSCTDTPAKPKPTRPSRSPACPPTPDPEPSDVL